MRGAGRESAFVVQASPEAELGGFLLAPKASEASMGAFNFWGACKWLLSWGVWLLLCYRGPTHKGGKSGCKLVTEFDSYSDDGVSAVIGVQHIEVANLGASW